MIIDFNYIDRKESNGDLTPKVKEYLAHHFERDPNDGFDIDK